MKGDDRSTQIMRNDRKKFVFGLVKPLQFSFLSREYKVGFALGTVKSIDDKLVIIDDKKADTTKTVDKERVSVTEEKEVIIQYKIPKWCWYVLIYSSLLTVWTIKKFIPYLKLLPF